MTNDLVFLLRELRKESTPKGEVILNQLIEEIIRELKTLERSLKGNIA